MRRFSFMLVLAVVGLSTAVGFAQGPGGQGGPGRGGQGGQGQGGPGRGGPGGFGGGMFGGRGFPNPIMEALDADKNGELSAEEIANAAVALKKLDKDNDGKLSAEELRPVPPTPEQMAEQFVARMMENDANKDGKLVVDEVPDQVAQFIGRADADGNGEITKEELTVFAKENAARGFGGRGFGGDRGGRPGGEGGARPERPARPE